MHHWQDWILAFCVLNFNLGLIPSVISSHKPRFITSIWTATFVTVQTAVFADLHLWYATSMAAVNALLWWTLGTQRYLQLHRQTNRS
jgi:hypothetical protein